MLTIEFKFEQKQIVLTPLGDKGIVDMMGFGDGINKYYIKTSTSCCWFDEDQLTLSE